MLRIIATLLTVGSIVACGDPPTGSARRGAHSVSPSRTQIAPDSVCFRLIVRPGESLPPFETRPDLNDPHIQQCG